MPLTRRQLTIAASISTSAAFLFLGYAATRNASSTLFKQAYGTANLPLLMAIMPLGVLALLYVYARLLSALGPRRTLLFTTLGSGLFIAACYAAIRLEPAWPPFRFARAVLRVFSEAYIALLVEQYWSLINSTYDHPAAKKLNGPIMGVASLGAIAGGLLVGQTAVPWGTANMLLIAALSVLPAAALSDHAHRAAGEPTACPGEQPRHTAGLAWSLLLRSPMMLSLLAMILSTQVVAAVVDLNFQTVLQNAIPDPDRQTQWAGRFEALMNAAAAFMQFLATPLLLRFLPVGAILLAMPLIQLAVSAAAATRPGLATSAGAYLVFKTFDYSLFKAAKEILYIPLSFDARYRVKELIDVLGYRTAKGATSAALALVAHAGAAVARLYTPVALAGALAWACAAAAVTRAARRLPTGQDPAAAPAAADFSTPPSDPAPARR